MHDININDKNKNANIAKKRIRELDLARGYSILFVIATHVDLFKGIIFKTLFYNFAVPFFFFASAFSLTLKYSAKDNIDLKEFYKNRFHYYLLVYFIYAFIILFLGNLQEYHYSFTAFIAYYLTNSLLGNVQTIWFLYVLFYFYLIFPFFLKCLNKKKDSLVLIFLVLSILIMTIIYSNPYLFGLFCKTIIINELNIDNYAIPINITKCFLILFMIPFFLLGYLFGKNYAKIKNFISQKKIFYVITITYSLFVLFLFINQDFIEANFYNLDSASTYYSWVNLFYSLFTIVFLLTLFIKFNKSRFFYFNGKHSANLFLLQRPVILILRPFKIGNYFTVYFFCLLLIYIGKGITKFFKTKINLHSALQDTFTSS
jgi:peptidoglycan/LPS O-acetylase OafA/YrhL